MPAKDIPALSGLQLIELLCLAGWEEQGNVAHGVFLVKYDCVTKRQRWVTVPTQEEIAAEEHSSLYPKC